MTFEELHSQPVVTEQSPEVEAETTAPSTSETETAPEVDASAADTLDQPTEDVKEPTRAQQRIQQLVEEKKKLQEKADYWDALQAKLPEASVEDDEDGVVTVDSIADAVIRKQKAESLAHTKQRAQEAMQQDALEALQTYPQLESDDELADMVVAYAERNKLSFKAAANRVISRIESEQKKAQQKAKAELASRAGASTPSGGRVSSGDIPAPDLRNMSEEEKAANWGQIISGFGR